MEEELNGLWLQAGGEDIGSFEDFKTDLQSDAKMQEWAWKKFGGEKVGSLEDFKVDFGFTTPTQKPAPKVNKQVNIPATPIVALPKTKPVRINVSSAGVNWAEGTLTDPDEDGNVIANLPKVSTIKSEISDIDNQLTGLSKLGVNVSSKPGKKPKPNAQGYSWESGTPQDDVIMAGSYATTLDRGNVDREQEIKSAKELTKVRREKEQQKKDVIVSSLKATDVNNYIREDVYEDFEGTIAQKGGDDRAFYETLIDGAKDVEDDIKFVVDYNMKQLANKYSDNFSQYLAESAQIRENSSDEVKQKFAQKYKDIIQDPLNTEIWELQEKYNQVQPFKDGVAAEMFKDPEVAKLYADQEEVRKNREGITGFSASTGIPLLDQGLDIVGRNLARGLARAEKMIGGVVGMVDRETGGQIIRRGSDLEKLNPKSTVYEGIAEEWKVDSDDFEFVFENETDTEPLYVRYKDSGKQASFFGELKNSAVNYNGEVTPVVDILAKGKKYKESNLSVYTSMFSDTVLDLFTQVGATKAVAVPLKFVGAGQRAAYTVGSAMSAFGQTKGAALEDLIKEKGLTADQREWLSTAKGLTTSAVNFINPIEAKLASGELSTLMGKAISRNAAKFAKGEIPLGEMVKVMGVSGLKGAGSELAEEGIEKGFDTKVINPIANKLYGTNLVTETSDGEWESIIKISAGVGLLADVAGNIRYDKSDIQTEALKTVVANPEMYKAYIEGMRSTNAEHANALDRVVRPIVDEISILGDNVSDKTKLDIASSMLAAQKLSQDIAKISNPVLAKTKQAELDALYSEIATMESGSKKTSGSINYEKGAEPTQDYEVGDELMIGREPRVITSIVKDEKTGKITSINYDKVKETTATKAEEVTTPNDDIVDVAPEDVTETLVENKPTEMVAEEVTTTPVQETAPSTEREQAKDVNEKPQPRIIKDPIVGDVPVYENYIPAQSDVDNTALYTFRATSIDGIPELLRSKATKTMSGEINGVKNETWSVSIGGSDLLGMYKKQAPQASEISQQGVSATQPEIVAPGASSEATGDVLPNFVAKNKAGGNIEAKTYKRTPEGKWQTIDKDGKVLANVGEAIAQQLEAERGNLRKAAQKDGKSEQLPNVSAESNTPSGTTNIEEPSNLGDSTTTATPEGVQKTTVLESVGKTEAEVIDQIQKFFTNSAAKNQKEAKEMATLNYKILEQIGKYFGGDAQTWIQAKLAKIGVISTVDEARALGRTQFQILGEKGAAALDAAEEATTRLDNLKVARDMEAAGKDAKTIKMATGWERGKDDKWRYEVADNISVKEGGLSKIDIDGYYIGKITDILNIDDLILSYPQLKDVRLVILPLNGNYPDVGMQVATPTADNIKTLFIYADNYVQTNSDGVRSFSQSTKAQRQFLDHASHELQHIISDYEGFPRGGTNMDGKRQIESDLRRLQGTPQGESLKKLYNQDPEALEFKYYERIAGEVEARNVEKRINMSPTQRRETLLAETEDVAREDQIIITDSFDGLANSIAAAQVIQNQNAIFETRDGDVIGFNYDTDKVARERFDIPKLKKIGSGSDRDVYDLGNGKVLKVAKTARGLTQNIYEGDGILAGGVTPKMYEGGLNYVVVDNVPNIKTTDVVKTYDWDGNEIGETTAGEMLKEFSKFSQQDFDNNRNGIQDVVAKYGMQDILSYDVLWNDFTAKRNWGYKDDKAVHTDAGTFGGVRMITSFRGVKNLSDPEFREIYNKSRAAKKKFGDTDKNTMYQANNASVYESAAVSETINKNLITELDRLIKEMSDPEMRKAKKISNEEALSQKRNLQAIRDGLVKAAADPRFQADRIDESYINENFDYIVDQLKIKRKPC